MNTVCEALRPAVSKIIISCGSPVKHAGRWKYFGRFNHYLILKIGRNKNEEKE
jgi:hypothetical protein